MPQTRRDMYRRSPDITAEEAVAGIMFAIYQSLTWKNIWIVAKAYLKYKWNASPWKIGAERVISGVRGFLRWFKPDL